MIKTMPVSMTERMARAWEAITGDRYLFMRVETLPLGQNALQPSTHYRVLDLRCSVMDDDRLICIDADPLAAIERAMSERP